MGQKKHDDIHITEEDFRRFVGLHSDTYISRWNSMDNVDIRIRWHFTAGIFYVFWLLYRKMYLYSVILLIAVGVTVNVVAVLVSRPISLTVGMAAVVFMGLYGNHMYRVHATRKIRDIFAETDDPDERARLLEARGGTTLVPHLVFILMLLLAYIIQMFRPAIGG